MHAVAYGFTLGIGLIISLGPQNLFLIERASQKNRPFLCATFCSAADILLITISTMGMGAALTNNPTLQQVFLILGGLFLFWYGGLNIKQGYLNLKHHQSSPEQKAIQHHFSPMKLVLMTLSFSLLNPHAWIDTVVIIGSASLRYHDLGLWLFTSGAVLASLLWFFTIALIALRCSESLTKPRNAGILSLGSGIIMLWIGGSLIHAAVRMP